MTSVSSERERLSTRLADLDEQLAALDVKRAGLAIERSQVAFGLDLLDRIEQGRKAQRSKGEPSTVEMAVEIVNTSGRQVWRVPDMVTALESKGWGEHITGNKTNAVRTALNRAAERGQIVKDASGGFVALAFRDEPATASDDPWATPAPITTGGGFSDEPPF